MIAHRSTAMVLEYGYTDLAMNIGHTGKLSSSDRRVVRGGSFLNNAANVRSVFRIYFLPVTLTNYFGFCVARTDP
jgi:formylglycine-generating enzyme required for sulfatase activity